MKKLVLSLALAGLLADGALAENEGFFVGALLGANSISSDVEVNMNTSTSNSYGYGIDIGGGASASSSYSGAKFGLLGGYLQNFGENFGARYYAQLDFGNYSTNFNANADALYSFYRNEEFDLELRGFGGLYAGYARYDAVGDDAVSGFDLGLNLGLRGVFKERHGIELFGKIGFLEQKGDTHLASAYASATGNYGSASASSDSSYTAKYRQTYTIGVRYTFTF